MLNYDVGWTDDMVNAAQSIMTETQDDLKLRTCSPNTAECFFPATESVGNDKDTIKTASTDDVECVLEPVVRRSSSSKRSFKWTPEQVRSAVQFILLFSQNRKFVLVFSTVLK